MSVHLLRQFPCAEAVGSFFCLIMESRNLLYYQNCTEDKDTHFVSNNQVHFAFKLVLLEGIQGQNFQRSVYICA